MAAARDTWLVAVYELGEGLRTRLFQVVLLGWAAGIGWATWLLVRLLREAERTVATRLGVPATERPGTLLAEVMKSDSFGGPARAMFGDALPATITDGSPIVAMWIGAAALAGLPTMLLFTSSGAVAGEVRTRSIRYLLGRTGRAEVLLGKAAGQVLLAVVAACLGAAVAFALGLTLMTGNDPARLAAELAARSACAVALALPAIGLGLAASQVASSPHTARAFAVGGLLILSFLQFWLARHTGTDALGRLADLGLQLLPFGTIPDLYSRDPSDVLPAAARCALMGVAFTSVGWLRFRGRDV